MPPTLLKTEPNEGQTAHRLCSYCPNRSDPVKLEITKKSQKSSGMGAGGDYPAAGANGQAVKL